MCNIRKLFKKNNILVNFFLIYYSNPYEVNGGQLDPNCARYEHCKTHFRFFTKYFQRISGRAGIRAENKDHHRQRKSGNSSALRVSKYTVLPP